MLLPKDTNPEYTTYYHGAVIASVINNSIEDQIDFIDLFEEVKKSYNLSLQSFIFALDWLFVLGSIKLNDIGRIEKCF
jgi:uncharacterized membrane protein